MVNEEPKVNPNGRYPIGEAAKLLGIDRGTLRRYTNQREIKCGYGRLNKRKFYYGHEIIRFWRTA